MKRILVLGGGMGGVEAAIALKTQLQGDYQIDLISNRDFLYIYPASIWLTVGKRKFEDLCLPIPQLAELHGFNFLHEEVKAVKAREQKVFTTEQAHQYDYLVVALGSSKVKPKGLERIHSICGAPTEGVEIQEQFFSLVNRGYGAIACGFSGHPQDATAVRGGPVFEVIFNFDQYLRDKGLRDRFELTFFSPSPTPGKRLGDRGLEQLQTLFAERNIDIGKEGVFVYRDENKAIAPRGAWAHWGKLAWEKYYKLNKHKKVPRLTILTLSFNIRANCTMSWKQQKRSI
jgi:sulfide:quinone oxidoreductase